MNHRTVPHRYAEVIASWFSVFCVVISTACTQQSGTFAELQDRLNRDSVDRVADQMLQENSEGIARLVALSLDQSRRELRHAPDQLWFQLTARNVGSRNDELARFLGNPPSNPMLVAKSATLRQSSPAVLRVAFDGELKVSFMRLSNDGSKLFCCVDGSLRVLDADSLKELARFEWPAGSYAQTSRRLPDPWVGVDANGKVLFANDYDEYAQPVASGWERAFAGVHGGAGQIYSTGLFTRDGTHIISETSGGYYEAIRVAAPLERVSFSLEQGVPHRAIFMRFLPDGERVLVGDESGTIRLFQWQTGKQIQPARNLVGMAACYAMSADGSRLVAGSSYNHSSDSGMLAKVWDIEGWKEIAAFDEPGPGYAVAHWVDFLGDRDTIVTLGSGRSGLKVWRIGADQPVRSLASPTELMYCAVNRSGKLLYALAENRTVLQLDVDKLPDSPPRRQHSYPVIALAISHDERLAASLDSHGGLALWDIQTALPVERLELQQRPHLTGFMSEPIPSTMAFAPDSKSVFVATRIDDRPTIINWAGQPRKRRDVAAQDPRLIPGRAPAESSRPYLLPDGTAAVCRFGRGNNRSLILFDPTTGKSLRDQPPEPEQTPVIGAPVRHHSPDGHFLLTGDDQGNLKIWDSEQPEPLATFTLDRKITTIQFDGRTVVVGDSGGYVHLFEWQN